VQHSWSVVPWNRSLTALWLGERAAIHMRRRSFTARACTKSPAMYSGPLSGQDRSDLHAVTSIETEHGQGQQSLDDMGGCGFGHGGLAPALGHRASRR
jgi:hypothetical protein